MALCDTRAVHSSKSKLFVCWCIVGCLGHYPPFLCLTFSLADTFWCWWGVVGVLCENCIVDASIKHAGWAALCGLFVCVCVISFFFSQFFCQVHLCGHCVHFVVCGGLCVRYLGRMVDALAC